MGDTKDGGFLAFVGDVFEAYLVSENAQSFEFGNNPALSIENAKKRMFFGTWESAHGICIH